MKKLMLAFLSVSCLASGLPAQDKVAAIREVILEAYVNGAYNDGIVRNMELGFSPRFKSIGLTEEGHDTILTLQEWMEQVRQQKARGKFPLPQEEKVSVRYDKIDIVGDIANVKFTFLVGNKPRKISFIDLFRYPTGWMIVNETYQQTDSGLN